MTNKTCILREWVSPATVTYMMNELIENDADHPDLTEVDFIFKPLVCNSKINLHLKI